MGERGKRMLEHATHAWCVHSIHPTLPPLIFSLYQQEHLPSLLIDKHHHTVNASPGLDQPSTKLLYVTYKLFGFDGLPYTTLCIYQKLWPAHKHTRLWLHLCPWGCNLLIKCYHFKLLFFCSVKFLKEGLENICIWQMSNTSISQTHKPCLQLSGGHSLTAMMTYYRDKAAINHHISILKTALTKTIVITYGLCFYILCHNLCICLALSAFVSHFFLFFFNHISICVVKRRSRISWRWNTKLPLVPGLNEAVGAALFPHKTEDNYLIIRWTWWGEG